MFNFYPGLPHMQIDSVKSSCTLLGLS